MVPRDRFIEAYVGVLQKAVRGGPPIGPQTSVIDSGRVDSFALADLIAQLEAATSLRLPTERLSPGDFDTAELLANRLANLGLVG